jgi:hypothetical protein
VLPLDELRRAGREGLDRLAHLEEVTPTAAGEDRQGSKKG